MEPEFLSFTEKLQLVEAVKNGERFAEGDLINELARLENLVKDYYIAVSQCVYRNDQIHGKTPNLTYNQK